jgi:hypothetical protein
MSSLSVSSANSATQIAPVKPQSPTKSQSSRQVSQPKVEQTTMAQKNAVTHSPQAGGNGVPPKPVSTSTKTVQNLHRINVQA